MFFLNNYQNSYAISGFSWDANNLYAQCIPSQKHIRFTCKITTNILTSEQVMGIIKKNR